MSKKSNQDHRPLSRDELKRLAIAAGLSDPKQPFNFGKHTALIYRLIGETLRNRRDKAVKNTQALSRALTRQSTGGEKT